MKPARTDLSITPTPHEISRVAPIEGLLLKLALAAGLLAGAALVISFAAKGRLHAPNLALLAAQPAMLKVHVAVAVAAFLLGALMLIRTKGDALHRVLGWVWVIVIMATAISSFLFPAVLKGSFSPIHVLSGVVAITAPMAVAAARRHDIRAHRRGMTLIFLFGMILAGAYTLMPGRLMWRVFFG